MGVFVAVGFGEPRHGAVDLNAQFFGKLAAQCRQFALARLHLAAGKFPIARIGLACGARTEQHLAAIVIHNAGHHLQQRAGVGIGRGDAGVPEPVDALLQQGGQAADFAGVFLAQRMFPILVFHQHHAKLPARAEAIPARIEQILPAAKADLQQVFA